MTKILTGTCCWFGRANLVNGYPRRVQYERNSFDALADKEIRICINHGRKIGTGRIKIQAWGVTYEMPIPEDEVADLEKLIRAEKIVGSSFSMTSIDYVTLYDSLGYFDSIKKVLVLHEVGPNSNPAERLTSCEIVERAVPAAVASRPVAGKRKMPRMNCPPMPKAMLNGIAIFNAALAGTSVRINGRTLSAGTVSMLVANAGPMSIH